jgi:hypothetical protein
LISMMRDALNGRFDVVLAEALDRFSQDHDENLRARQIVAVQRLFAVQLLTTVSHAP